MTQQRPKKRAVEMQLHNAQTIYSIFHIIPSFSGCLDDIISLSRIGHVLLDFEFRILAGRAGQSWPGLVRENVEPGEGLAVFEHFSLTSR